MIELLGINLPSNKRAVVKAFMDACQVDDRILAAFLSGSYARGSADRYSDLDLSVITTDESFSNFITQRNAFVKKLGPTVFIEDFDHPKSVFVIMADGTEVELAFGSKSRLEHIHSGPYRALVDKQNILAGAIFHDREPTLAEQTEKLRRSIYWFWHDVSHFINALSREQYWWAQGQLEVLRRCCINLAHLNHNFLGAFDWDDPYFKIENALPVAQIEPLKATFCALEKDELLKAGLALIRFYKGLAVPLAQAHNIVYPEVLEREMVGRLENLQRRP